MELLTVYDIADAKRLRHVAKIMQRFGIRVQKSVFECDLSQSALNDMRKAVNKAIDATEDTIRIYPLLDNSREKQILLGCSTMVDFPPAYIL